MDLDGAPFPMACRNPNLAAELASTGHTELGFDSVNALLQYRSGVLCPRMRGSMANQGQLAYREYDSTTVASQSIVWVTWL